jgi:hypothetical protein
MAADISDHLVAKIDERCRRLDQVDQAIAEVRRLQHEIAPFLRPPTERDPAPQRQGQRHRTGPAIERRIMDTRGGIQLHGRILDTVFLSKRNR